MGLETHGSGSILTENFDGRRLELQATFAIEGGAGLDPQGKDWEAQKIAYGRQVAIQVADQAVPQILAELGIDNGAAADFRINAKSSLDGELEAGQIGGNVLDIRQQIGGVFRLTADREMTVGELVSAARDSIAGHVANHAVFALEHHFDGKQTSNTDFQIRRENGEIGEFGRAEVPPAPAGAR